MDSDIIMLFGKYSFLGCILRFVGNVVTNPLLTYSRVLRGIIAEVRLCDVCERCKGTKVSVLVRGDVNSWFCGSVVV